VSPPAPMSQSQKSFLLLFFKKEALFLNLCRFRLP
jgi:hypothetical protein